jgi:transcriptional regulator with XRE-family HTH domain
MRNSIPTFPARLRELRERQGLSREELAHKAGTSEHSVTKLEIGSRAPSLELASRLAAALGCTVDSLLQPPEADIGPRGRGRPRKDSDSTNRPPKPRGSRR